MGSWHLSVQAATSSKPDLVWHYSWERTQFSLLDHNNLNAFFLKWFSCVDRYPTRYERWCVCIMVLCAARRRLKRHLQETNSRHIVRYFKISPHVSKGLEPSFGNLVKQPCSSIILIINSIVQVIVWIRGWTFIRRLICQRDALTANTESTLFFSN